MSLYDYETQQWPTFPPKGRRTPIDALAHLVYLAEWEDDELARELGAEIEAALARVKA